MVDSAQHAPLNHPVKRRPPKLRKVVTETTAKPAPPTSLVHPQSQPQPQYHPPSYHHEAKGVTVPYPHVHQEEVHELHDSEVESQSSGDRPPSPEVQPTQHVERQTLVLDREHDDPHSWQQSLQHASNQQQLVQVDDVHHAGEVVRDVGQKTVRTVGDTARGVVGSAVQAVSRPDREARDEQLRLRLDLNLDVEVQLKAKIHGDLTLQLLYVTHIVFRCFRSDIRTLVLTVV
ncbi:hypothetical protein BJX61DRAFT_544028 [Aspergillus egyptiacus]|nr:hypothetical protein BJX61DRAFT_544028 [Aspergillus egyptiacus]